MVERATVKPGLRKRVATKKRAIVQVFHRGQTLYQLERVRCGNARCKRCKIKLGGHGPYWYAYRWVVRSQKGKARLVSTYVGKQLTFLKGDGGRLR
jgi:hypothetical protein